MQSDKDSYIFYKVRIKFQKSNSSVQTELLWTLWNTSCSLNSLWKSAGKEPWFTMNVPFSFQLSNRTEDFLHFGLYSVSFSSTNTILIIKKLTNTSNKLFLIKEKVWQGKIDHLQFKCMTFVYSQSFIHHFMGLFGTNIKTSSQLAW